MKARFTLIAMLFLLAMVLAPWARGQSYCTPTATNQANYNIGIQTLNMGAISNSTGTPNPNQFYNDYSSTQQAFYAAGATVNYSVLVGPGNNTRLAVYIDWDNDKTFSASEQMDISGSINASNTYNGSFQVPSGQSSGLYRMRVVGDLGSQTPDPCNVRYTGEIEDYSFVVLSPSLDVAATETIDDLNIGNNTVSISFANLTSGTTINSVDIGYSVNNGTPVTQSLSSLNLASGNAMTQNFSTNLNISTPGVYTLKVWARNPNNAGAGINSNDTITKVIQACYPLNGAYTIDPNGSGGSNYTSFTAAVNDLVTCGINGAVTFNVASGTYTEQISLPFISGVSATNTITFSGAGKASTVLTYASQTADERYTLQLDGASYITFEDMTIRSTNGSYGYTVHLTGGSGVAYNNLKRLNIDCAGGGGNTTSTNFIPLVFSGSNSNYNANVLAYENTVDSCDITGGYFNISFYGNTSTNANYGNVFSNNTLTGAYYYGVYALYLSEMKVIANDITLRTSGSTTTNGYGMYLANSNNSYPYQHEIRNNRISAAGRYGIYLTSSDGSVGARGILANNFIGGDFSNTSTTYGIYMSYSDWWNVYYNSINMDRAVSSENFGIYVNNSNNTFNLDVRNNQIRVNGSGSGQAFAVYGTSNTLFGELDYNNYWVTNSADVIFLGQSISATSFIGALNLNKNSYNLDAPFQSATNLRYTNGCITGIPVSGVTDDIDGNTRTSTPNVGADEFINTATNDIGILSISAPAAPVTTGTQNVVVRMKNFGTNTITSAQVSYIHNNGTPVTINWTGTLLPCGEVDVTFSGSDQVDIVAGINNIQAYTSSPNNTADNFPGNDGTATQVCPAMSGTFTINPSGTASNNFPSFSAAVEALNCSGLNGPVTFNVAAGTYVEQVTLSNVSGVSAQNTITFDGGTGNAATRILTFGNTQAGNRHTFLLDNMQHVTLKNLTIEGQGSSYAWVLHILGNSSSDITVQNCNITMKGNGTSNTGTNYIAVLLNGSTTSYSTNGSFSNILFENNKIEYGYFGVYARGNGSSNTNVVYRNNEFNQNYYYALYHYQTDAVKVNGNRVDMRTNNTNSYGIYIGQVYVNSGQGSEVNKNVLINVGRYGIYLNGASNNASNRGTLINNMIGGGFRSTGTRALYMQSADYWDVYYNSINVDCQLSTNTYGPFYGSSSDYLDIQNNVFAITHPSVNSGSIYAMYMNGSTALICDYNNFYKPGTTNNFIRVNGSIYNASNFQGGGGFNTNSYFQEPGFLSNLDLHTNNGCLIGNPINGVNDDIDGDTRGSQPSIGADEGSNLDASLLTIIDPSGTNLSGTQDVRFTVKNTGKTTITSFDANYAINGGTPVTQGWSGTLLPCDEVTITFTGAQAATIPNSGVVTLGTFIGNVNSSNDDNQDNDTLVGAYCNGPLDGVYTVNPGSAANRNFPDLETVINVLNSCGMSGNTEIRLAAGTYRNQLFLSPGNIAGLNTYNLTFEGQDSASTIITYDGGVYTVRLNGADNITFRKLAIENTGSSNAFAVHLTNGSDNNVFENCAMRTGAISNTTVITFGIMGNTYTQTGTIWGENNRVENCHITGGYRTVNVYGGASNQLGQNNRFINNYIADGLQYLAYNYYQQGVEYTGNTILGGTQTGGIYMSYCPEILVQRNRIMGASNYLLYMNQCSPNNTFARGLVANNMLGGLTTTGTGYGIYNINTYNMDFFHNSIYIGTDNNSSRAFYNSSGNGNRLINNIIVSDAPNGHAVYFNTNNSFTDVNHNIYSSASTALSYTWGSTYFDLASWQAANAAWNTDSYEETPNWVSVNNLSPDLHLDNSVPARYGDNTLGIDVDYDNESRCPSAKTIGADESKYITAVSVNFTVNDTVFVSSPFTAINSAIPGTLNSYQWDFNNDGSVDATTLNATYTFQSPGVKQIKLKSLSCTNADSVIKTVVVITPTAAPEADFIADKYSVAPFELVTLQDLSTNGPIGWLWEITPDNNNTVFYDPFDQNPQVFFGDPGVYEVCLTAQNALGTSNKKCKTAYITVRDVNSMCIGNDESSSGTGEIHDPGGPDAPYGNNQNCTFLIDPCASSVNLKFSEFSVANAGHFLRIYDGRDATGTLIGTYSSSSGLPGGTNGLTANSGAMFLTWTTNATGTAAGFSATWTTVADTTNSLTAGFTAPDSAYVQELVNFTNTSSGNGLDYSWDFDNDGVEDASSRDASFLFTLDGVYPIKLDVSDACGNSASIIDSIVVVTPTSVPNVDFMADARVVTTTDTVRFTDLSDNGPINWNYTFNPATVDVVGGSARNPLVLFNDTGFYEVTLNADNAAGTGTLTKTAYIHVIEICQGSVSALVPDLGINQVRLNQLNHSSSSGVVGYTSYFNDPSVTPAQLDAGGNYDLVVSRNTTLNRMNRKVWIDYNADGDFDDANELVGSESSALTTAWTLNLTIPTTAVRGATRMRIGTSFADSTNEPCGTNFYGEIEEYRVVINDDITPPVITRLGISPVYIELGQTYTDDGATATDAVDGNLTSSIITTNNVNTNASGTYYVYYNVTDAAGNQAEEVSREVIVRPDNTPPVLQLTSPTVITVPLDSTFDEPGFSAIDAISGNVTSSVIIDRSAYDSTIIGTYEIKYIASDAFGNTDTQSRFVNVVDIIAPTITLNGNNPMDVDVNVAFNDPGVNVTDNYDQNVNVTVTSNVNINALGSYSIQYEAMDSSGNISLVSRTVNVVDNVAPQITVSSTDTIVVEVFGNLVLPDASATDNYDADPQISTSGTYDLTTLGNYTVDLAAEDASGNQSQTVSIVIRVVDTEAPVITLNGSYLTTIERWADFVDPGVTISDNYYTNLTPVTGGNFTSTSEEGLYYISYDVTDGSGNVAQQVTRAINIVGSTTGLDKQVSTIKFNMYPNPATDMVQLEVDANLMQDADVVIYNALGQVVHEVKWNASMKTISINLNTIEPGVYYVAVNSGTQRSMQKLIISK